MGSPFSDEHALACEHNLKKNNKHNDYSNRSVDLSNDNPNCSPNFNGASSMLRYLIEFRGSIESNFFVDGNVRSDEVSSSTDTPS